MPRITNIREILSEIPATGEELASVSHTLDKSFLIKKLREEEELVLKFVDYAETNWRVQIYADLTLARLNSGRKEEAQQAAGLALKIADGIEDGGWRDIAYDYVVSAHATLGQYEEAKGIAGRIKRPGHRVGTYGKIAIAQARAGKSDEAKQTLEFTLEFIEALEDESEKSSANRSLVEVQERLGIGDWMATVRKIDSKLSREQVYSGIARSKNFSKKYEETIHIIKSGLSELGLFSDNPSWRLYAELAFAQAKTGNIEESRKNFELALRSVDAMMGKPLKLRFCPNRSTIYLDIAQYQVRAGMHDEAVRTVETAVVLRYSHKEYDVNNVYLSEKCRLEVLLGNDELAKQLAREGKRGKEDFMANYGRIVDIQAEKGDFSAALQTAAEMNDSLFKTLAYLSIASSQADRGMVCEAQENIELASQTAMKSGQEDLESHTFVMEACSRYLAAYKINTTQEGK